ncbi:MAG: DUF2846 domain-containing protein [Terracidiphilus sp.]|jgi:hypothetical protein
MRNVTLDRVARICRPKSAFHVSATLLLVSCALMLLGSRTSAQDAQPAAPAQDAKADAVPTPPSAPSPGKALIYIYRVGRFVGSAAHDHLFINGVYLAYLLNGEYAWMEVAPGTAVVTGMPEMYYGGIIQSTGAALSEARRKENERIRLDVEAGKTYYLKWTSGTMATGIKVALQDQGVAAKEMSKLHPSKPVVQPDDKTKGEWK